MNPGQPRAGSFGRFTLRRELGRGGSAVVWEAFDPQAERTVALKLLYAAERASDALHERLRREAEILARLRHPHVVRVFEAGSVQGTPYVALELVCGGSLHDAMRRGGLSLEVGLELLDQVAQALQVAHQAGVVHRDLKPGNVLLDELGRAKVVDFGVARLEGASVDLTRPGEVLGTLRYMAPEQVQGKAVDARADVYSLGAILYELLVGAPPWADRAGTAELLEAIHTPGPVPPPSALRADVPPALDTLCARALEKDPARRIDLAQLRQALAEARRELREGEPQERGAQAWILPLAGVLALALPLSAFLLTGRSGPAPSDPAVSAPPPPDTPGPPPIEPEHAPPTAPPAWWSRLPAGRRPPLPLPEGVRFGDQPGEYVHLRDGSVLVWVPGGRFRQGGVPGEGDPWEVPAHDVELSPFFLGKYEVTVAQFRAFVAATGHVTVSEREGHGVVFLPPEMQRADDPYGNIGAVQKASWSDGQGDQVPDADDMPVAQVAPVDADAYVRWAGLRLPSEAEWERAAGWEDDDGRARRFPWGEAQPHAGSGLFANLLDERAHALWPRVPWVEGYDDGCARAARVGQFPAGASPVGAQDMGGNLAEIMADGFDEGFYGVAPARDPLRDPDGQEFRVVRGGSFYDTLLECRVCARWKAEPLEYNEKLGFRVVLGAR